MSYNKSEKHTNDTEFYTDYKTIKNSILVSILTYFTILLNLFGALMFLFLTINLYCLGEPAAFIFSFFTIIYFYICFRSWLVDIKGKLYYNDTQLHYEGHTFEFLPQKHIVDIPWNEITSARVYSKNYLRGVTREILLLKKSDDRIITLNTCYFDNSKIIDLIHKHILSARKENPIEKSEEYQITIHNYSSSFSIRKNYLQLEIFTNENSIKTRDKQIKLSVKTGDILALKHYNYQLQLIRLKDPSLTEFYVDNYSNDFDLVIK